METYKIKGWVIRGAPHFDFKYYDQRGYIDPTGDICFDGSVDEADSGFPFPLGSWVPWEVALKARQLWEEHNTPN
jgi:hypothetical protein